MAKLSSLASDLTLEKEGVWFRYRDSDFYVKVARARSAEFEAACRKLVRSLRMSKKLQDPETNLEELSVGRTSWDVLHAVAPAVAKHITRDWRGLEGEDGKDIPFSIVQAKQMLEDPQYRDFYEFVLACANDADEYSKAVEREDLGNLQGASNGTSTTDQTTS